MRKLFDEVNEYDEGVSKRTVWLEYKYSLDSDTAREIGEATLLEMKSESKYDIEESQIIFYSDQVHLDAMDDEVRFGVYIRFLKGVRVPDINVNMSDVLFSSSYDDIMDFVDEIADTILEGRNFEDFSEF